MRGGDVVVVSDASFDQKNRMASERAVSACQHLVGVCVSLRWYRVFRWIESISRPVREQLWEF
jgi:hypothetical protein